MAGSPLPEVRGQVDPELAEALARSALLQLVVVPDDPLQVRQQDAGGFLMRPALARLFLPALQQIDGHLGLVGPGRLAAFLAVLVVADPPDPAALVHATHSSSSSSLHRFPPFA
jgi:hypothetical protein